jgi:oxygen-independent coproporphyrinogen-3 oxidase
MKDYIDWVSEQAKVAPQVAWLPEETRSYQSEDDSDLDRITDVIMTRLRTSEGLDMAWVDKNIPGGRQAILQGASLGLELGLAELVQRYDGGEFLRLVDPEGFLFSNSIISSIFVELAVTEDE